MLRITRVLRKKKRQTPDELSVYDVGCLTHYMVVHKGLKSSTIPTRFLYVLYVGNENKLNIYFSIRQTQIDSGLIEMLRY